MQKFRLILTKTEMPRKVRVSDPTHCFDRGKVLWNVGLMFRPTDEHFDINILFDRLPEDAQPSEQITDFIFEMIERRIPEHPKKKEALDGLTISRSMDAFEWGRKSPLVTTDHEVLGLKINDECVAIYYPRKSNLSNLNGSLSGGGLLNELNGYAHGIVESVTSQARESVLAGADALIEALDRILPIPDNYLNSQIEDLKRQVKELQERVEKGELNREQARSYLGLFTEGFVKGLGSGEHRSFHQSVRPMVMMSELMLLRVTVSHAAPVVVGRGCIRPWRIGL